MPPLCCKCVLYNHLHSFTAAVLHGGQALLRASLPLAASRLLRGDTPRNRRPSLSPISMVWRCAVNQPALPPPPTSPPTPTTTPAHASPSHTPTASPQATNTTTPWADSPPSNPATHRKAPSSATTPTHSTPTANAWPSTNATTSQSKGLIPSYEATSFPLKKRVRPRFTSPGIGAAPSSNGSPKVT
jgi:hypothetical protein